MQLKKKHSALLSDMLPALLFMLMLAGCNNDVFVPRPDFSSYTIKTGETIKIQLPQNAESYGVWLDVTYCGDVIYNGYPDNFRSDLIGIHYSVNSDFTEASVGVDFNYLPEPINFKVGFYELDGSFDIKVLPELTQKYVPGMIEYDMSQWTYDTENYLYQVSCEENKTSEPVTLELTPERPFEMVARFQPNDITAFMLFTEKDFLLPVLAVDSRGFPVETDHKIPFGGYYTAIPGYELKCDEQPYRYTLAPGQKAYCLISVENRLYYFDYTLEATNADGVTLSLPGKLVVTVPQRYIYEVKPE